jgi:hypothetical protein
VAETVVIAVTAVAGADNNMGDNDMGNNNMGVDGKQWWR